MLTGCRSDEILSLKWDDVGRTARVLRLRDAKTGPRMVPLIEAALRVLDGIERTKGVPWVFRGAKAGSRLACLSHHWRRIKRETGLHDLRVYDLIDIAENFEEPDWRAAPTENRRNLESVTRDWLEGVLQSAARTMNTSEHSVERSSGNVFADLDLPDADTHLMKAELVSRIDDIIRKRTVQGPRCRQRQRRGRGPGPVRRADHRTSARTPDRPRAVRATGCRKRQCAGQEDLRPTGAMT